MQKFGRSTLGAKAVRRAYTLRQLSHDPEVKANPSMALDYLVAPPQMALYMKRSTEIYNIYLNYVSPADIHVYSIDEVFMDVTDYLATYRCTARELS